MGRKLDVSVLLKDDNDEEEIYILISNLYYYDMIKRACNILNYQYPKSENNNELIAFIKETYSRDVPIDIDEIIDAGYMEQLIEQLTWVIDKFIFALNIIEESRANFADKNIKDMLDEL